MQYLFKNFTLDPERFELTADGVPVKTEPQIIELLTLLVANPGRLLSKDEISERIWKGRVVSDSALSRRIKTLRQLLGDSGKAQEIIQTVHRKGFRFIAEVSARNESEQEAEPRSNNRELSHASPTVAVLPFVNLAPEAEEYFSDGVSSDVIAQLGKHRWLNVIARNTSFGFKYRSLDVREIGRGLHTDYVIEGSVRRAGDRIRVGVSLIDAKSRFQVWSEQYDRRVDDIFDVQDEITQTSTARLEPEIGYAERHKVVISRPANLQAWAWWAYAVVLGMVYRDTEPGQELLNEALAACNRALAIDRQNATFHALRARVHLARYEYHQAIDANQRAIALNATFAAAHCGMGDSLAYEGRYDEAVDCFEKAIALSPNDPQLWAFYSYGALALIFKGDFAKALRWAELASTIPNSQYWATAHQAVVLAYLERSDEARQRAGKLQHECPDFCRRFAREKMFCLKRPEQIDKYLTGLQRAGIPAT